MRLRGQAAVKDRAGQHWLSKINPEVVDLESGDAEPLHELPGGASVFDSHVRPPPRSLDHGQDYCSHMMLT